MAMQQVLPQNGADQSSNAPSSDSGFFISMLRWIAEHTYRGSDSLSQSLSNCGHACEAFVLVFFTASLLLVYATFFSASRGVAWVGFVVCIVLALIFCVIAVGFSAAALGAKEDEKKETRFVINKWRLASLKADGLNAAVCQYVEEMMGEDDKDDKVVTFTGEDAFLDKFKEKFSNEEVARVKHLLFKHLRA